MKKLTILITLFISTGLFAKSFIPRTFTTDFEKTYKSTTTGKIKKTGGSLDYRYPGQVKLVSNKKMPTVYISNRDTTWYYVPPLFEGEEGQVTIQDSGKDPLSPFFDSLRYGLKSNKIYKAVKKKDHYLMTFNEKTKKRIGMSSAKLFFKDFRKPEFSKIIEIRLINLEGKEDTYKLTKMNTKAKLSKKHFDFKVPKGTRVSN